MTHSVAEWCNNRRPHPRLQLTASVRLPNSGGLAAAASARGESARGGTVSPRVVAPWYPGTLSEYKSYRYKIS